ncbi:MAG: four helix bundle protein [Pseudoxanthomonas sp.]
MAFQLPAIDKDSRRLRRDIELAVGAFSRSHRYHSGTYLRDQIREVQDLAGRAWFDKENKAQLVDELVRASDKLKRDLQLAKDVHAFRSFAQFEMLFRQAENIGRQAGGMQRQLKHPKGQNAEDRRVVPQRAQILSTGAASRGANA